MKTILLAIAMVCLLAASVQAQGLWEIREGVGGEWVGAWAFEPGKPSFPCELRNEKTGAVIVSSCVYVRQGNNIAVKRFDTSNNNPCNYFGQIFGKTLNGVYFCQNGGPYNWSGTSSGK